MTGRDDEPTVKDLTHAIGGLTALLAGHLEAAGVATVAELAGQIDGFARITHETLPNVGAILAYWAEVLDDVAAVDPVPPIRQ